MTIDELNVAKANLQSAIYSGVLEVRFGERWIRYQSLGEMRAALGDLNNEITTVNTLNASPLSGPRSMCNFAKFNG
jgi:hypothetical protein